MFIVKREYSIFFHSETITQRNIQSNQVIFSSILLLYTIKYVMVTYIVVIQIFGMNIKFIS